MKCPTANVDLKKADQNRIQINYGPQRRRAGLDGDALDNRTEPAAGEIPEPTRLDYQRGPNRGNPRPCGSKHHNRGRKRQSCFEEMFDIN